MKANRFIVPVKQNCINKNKDLISVVILAASAGYRMKGFGSRSLCTMYGGTTLLQHQINVIKRVFNNFELIIVSGFESDKLVKYKQSNVRFVENQLFDTTGEAEQLRLAINNITTDKLLLINGDTLFDGKSISEFKNMSSTLLYNNNDTNEIGATVVNNYLTYLSYDLEEKWSGITYLTNKELEITKKIINNRDLNKLFMFEIINKVIDKNVKINAFNNNSKIFKIMSSEHIEKMRGINENTYI